MLFHQISGLSKSISNIHCCNSWLSNRIGILGGSTWNTKGLTSLGSALVLGSLPHSSTLSVHGVTCLVLLFLGILLLQSNWQLAFCPSSCLGVPLEVITVAIALLLARSFFTICYCSRSSLCRRSLSSIHVGRPIHNLLSNICPVFLSFFNEVILFHVGLFLFFLFSLGSSNVAFGGLTNKIFFWNFLSLLFQNPVILIIIIMTTLIH